MTHLKPNDDRFYIIIVIITGQYLNSLRSPSPHPSETPDIHFIFPSGYDSIWNNTIQSGVTIRLTLVMDFLPSVLSVSLYRCPPPVPDISLMDGSVSELLADSSFTFTADSRQETIDTNINT